MNPMPQYGLGADSSQQFMGYDANLQQMLQYSQHGVQHTPQYMATHQMQQQQQQQLVLQQQQRSSADELNQGYSQNIAPNDPDAIVRLQQQQFNVSQSQQQHHVTQAPQVRIYCLFIKHTY